MAVLRMIVKALFGDILLGLRQLFPSKYNISKGEAYDLADKVLEASGYSRSISVSILYALPGDVKWWQVWKKSKYLYLQAEAMVPNHLVKRKQCRKVRFTEDVLKTNQNTLAFVLAHEFGHHLDPNLMRLMKDLTSKKMFLGYNTITCPKLRKRLIRAEFRADAIAMQLLRRIGYSDPKICVSEFLRAWYKEVPKEDLFQEGIYSIHPPIAERVTRMCGGLPRWFVEEFAPIPDMPYLKRDKNGELVVFD